MAVVLNKQAVQEIVPSLRRFFKEEMEQEIGEMRAKFLLDYILEEIAPFAYNQGVKDAEAFFRSHLEDLTGACFEEELSYWRKRKKG